MKKLNKILNMGYCGFNFDLKMKITTLFLIVSMFKISANTYSENTKISLKLEKINQEKVEITGTVLDENNQALPGVIIMAKGGISGTLTDVDGKFRILVPKGNGSIQKIKIWAGGANVNVYLEGNKTMQMELVDMYINSDGNTQTGFKSWQWPNGSGADYLFEGPLVSNGWGDFYQHNDPAGGWGWNPLAGSGVNLKSSGIVSVSATTNAIEFSIPKSQLGTMGKSIGFAFTEMTSGWGLVASFPEVTSSSAFAKIDF